MLHKNSIKRICFPGAIYYIVMKTKNNHSYFKETIFCDSFIEDLKICKELKSFKLYGFSIIYDHINLIIEPNDRYNISQIIKSLRRNVSRNINIIMGYKSSFLTPLVGETSLSRLRGWRLLKNVGFELNTNKKYPFKDINELRKRFFEKFGVKNSYPKFRWQLSFYDHYIRFHDNHLQKQKDWDYHYEYTVYNHLKHGLPENWQYTSLNYPELIDNIEI
jgi:REP element-mobilizing transposase RayT